VVVFYLLFFFFSSRRRHTRWNCDWSSDVCSSDLNSARSTVKNFVSGLCEADQNPYHHPDQQGNDRKPPVVADGHEHDLELGNPAPQADGLTPEENMRFINQIEAFAVNGFKHFGSYKFAGLHKKFVREVRPCGFLK